jgi:hypothetical protein
MIVGRDKWWLSLTCLASRSEYSCVDRPRLYDTVQEGRGGGCEEDMVGGWAGRLPARGWDKGSRIGVDDVLGGCTRKHLCKLTQTLKKTLRSYLMLCGFDFITVKPLLFVALFGIRVTKPGIQVTNVVTLCCRAAPNARPYCSVSRTRLFINDANNLPDSCLLFGECFVCSEEEVSILLSWAWQKVSTTVQFILYKISRLNLQISAPWIAKLRPVSCFLRNQWGRGNRYCDI